jgi:hypothetical protein
MKLFYQPRHAKNIIPPGEEEIEEWCGKCLLGAHHEGEPAEGCSCECALEPA